MDDEFKFMNRTESQAVFWMDLLCFKTYKDNECLRSSLFILMRIWIHPKSVVIDLSNVFNSIVKCSQSIAVVTMQINQFMFYV